MDVSKIVHKTLENAMRRFEKRLTVPQMKAVKSLFRGIVRKTTTVLSALNEEKIDNRKYRERISYHLGEISLVEEVEGKGFSCAKETEKVKGYLITSYDESDIFKPNAKKMQGLKRLRDGSTGLTGTGYIIRGININGISVYSRLEECDENKISKSEYVMEAIDHVAEKMGNNSLLYVLDRGGDCIELIDDLIAGEKKFLIRGKTNRTLIDPETKKRIKVSDFKLGKTKVLMEGGTEVFVWRVQRKGYKDPIILYTNAEELTDEECLSIYLKRRKIEEDFNKMKDLGLEDVRLFSMKKISNILAIIQFIVILSQDIFNEVMARTGFENETMYHYFKAFCKHKTTTMNPQSFIRFISEYLEHYTPYITSYKQDLGLFSRFSLPQKLGPI